MIDFDLTEEQLSIQSMARKFVDRLSGEIARIVRDPQFSKEKLLEQGYETLGSTPEQAGETMRSLLAKYARIVRDAKIPAE